MALVPGSSSVTCKWTYDVFLSFRGEDTRLTFVGHLYESLRQRGIRNFFDDKALHAGEEIRESLFKAIKESRIAIIVFSKNYASSTFCLDEPAEIVDCFKEEGQLLYPVFYHVDPADVRHQRGSYGEALAHLQKRFEDDDDKLKKWRCALTQAANLTGWHLQHGDEIEVIILELPEGKEIQWSGEEFMGMKNLKFLTIKSASFSRAPQYLPNSLRLLEWKGYPFEFLPSNFHPSKLVHLDMSNSCCAVLQPFIKIIARNFVILCGCHQTWNNLAP
ncbi:disease resistance protein RPV1-like [Prosopis cineraria]|uniref:disease resistance protein RPV1-like n=1 Tax=Prosopis cineraria TaxID=364024 RepID=UPI00240FBC0B|nr:disease resistance protein RPV1-like [Prosopis cineraria]